MIRYLRLEFDQLKERLYKTLICCIPRFRKIPVNCFGFFFWKEISKHTAKDQIKKCEQDIHSKSAAVEYCQQQISIKIPLDRPQWEMNYVENYSDSQSLLILKFHHAFSDGAGILNSMLFANKTEHISPEMRKGRAIPFYLEILNGLLFPIFILIASFELIRFNWNGYDKIKTKSGENSGENICVCSKQYNFEDIRKAYKQYDKATMNSFMMGIISKSISEWYHMNGVEETKNISTIIPVVMKPFSPNINEINIENWTSGITFRFPLKDNLNDAIRETSKNFGFYYQLPHLISIMIMLRSFAILPNWLSKYLYHFAWWNLGMTLSN